MRGKLQCLTVGSKNWLRIRRRFATGVERLLLQGVDIKRHQYAIDKTDESVLWMLAGNSVNFFNQAQGFLALLATIGEDLWQ